MQEKLLNSIRKCQDKNNYITQKMFPRLYPFTTENLSALLECFSVKDKSILTIDSSSDLAINANLKGASKVTIMDSSPLTKEYFYLKKAAFTALTYEEFINYFTKVGNEGSTFSLELYKKLRDYLKTLDKDSLHLWDKLYELFPGSLIRAKLFKNDEEELSTLKELNPYLKDEEAYSSEKDKIKDFTPIFISQNIKESIPYIYDDIFLSNDSSMSTKEIVDTYQEKIAKNLATFGKILIRYMYFCKDDKKLDIERFRYCYFDDLAFSFSKELIPGVASFTKESQSAKDGLLIYQKNR